MCEQILETKEVLPENRKMSELNKVHIGDRKE